MSDDRIKAWLDERRAALRNDAGLIREDRAQDAHNHFPAALEGIEAVLIRHRSLRLYYHESDCSNLGERHRAERHVEFAVGEYYCEDLPTGEVMCESCRDEDGERVDYPCETRRALERVIHDDQ